MTDFRGLVQILEQRGELVRVAREVQPRYEMPALMTQVDAQRRAYVFERVAGSRFPLVGGVLNRTACCGWAIGSPAGEPFSAEDLHARLERARRAPLAPREVASGPCKEVVQSGAAIDLRTLPVPTFFEQDSGPFITGACGISRNPVTGRLNAGIYRTLVLGPDLVSITATSSSDLRTFYAHAERLGEPMSIALAIGVEPALLLAAVCKIPATESELDLAGALLGHPLQLVRCETSDLLVPASAEFVIEAQVDFSRKLENTLGEFAGLYGPELAPVARVTAMTHRRDALFYSILAGRNPEHNTLGSIAAVSIQQALAAALRAQLPGIHDLRVYLESRLGSMAHVVLSIDKTSDAQPMRLIDAALAATFPTAGGPLPVSKLAKRVVIVDSDVDVHDLADVEWAIWTRVAAASKYRVIPDVASWELERCAKPGQGSLRLAIDATVDIEDRDKLRRTVIPGAGQFRLEDYAAGAAQRA